MGPANSLAAANRLPPDRPLPARLPRPPARPPARPRSYRWSPVQAQLVGSGLAWGAAQYAVVTNQFLCLCLDLLLLPALLLLRLTVARWRPLGDALRRDGMTTLGGAMHVAAVGQVR